MDEEILALADDFPTPSHADWLAAVDQVLAGRSFDVLRSTTADGILVEPLYTRNDEHPVEQYPGPGTSRRATSVAGLTGGWDVRQRHGLTTPAATNAAILADLTGGVTSIELLTAGIGDIDTLDAVLNDVRLDIAPVSLWGPGDGIGQAEWFLDLADRRGVATAELGCDLGCDPIGRLADHGTAGRPIDDALAALAGLAVGRAAPYPRARVARADGAPYANAGATPATELAATVATGVAYLRALTDAGRDVADALDDILLCVTVGTDQFGDIAKLRALRVVWARVAEACGAPDHRATIQASGATSVMARRDPWVNLLRGTLGCFAAAVGGADIVVVRPFDAMLGVPGELGLRIARNTQLALMEESNLHRVIDPAGGSWYVEQLTDRLAEETWHRFQELERDGGIVAALRAGALQRRIRESWAETEAAVASRRTTVVGVSDFAHLDEEPLERESYPSWPGAPGAVECEPLPVRRLAEPFEVLRDAADAMERPPGVFLANLGPASAHRARASWAANVFGAAGIRALDRGGFDDDEALATAFAAAGTPLAVICSSDEVYRDRAASAAAALARAGAARIYLAARPGFAAVDGVDELVHAGGDVLDLLRRAHDMLERTPEAR